MMSLYKHLTIDEREQIFLLFHQGLSIRAIAKTVKRSPSTISRELARNQGQLNYSPSAAQENYAKRKANCGRKRLLNNTELKARIKELFLEEQWSPEQIAARMQFEKAAYTISFNTFYRGEFNETNLSHGHRGAVRKLRHKGKHAIRKIISKSVVRFPSRIQSMSDLLQLIIVLQWVIGKLIP